MSAAGVPRHANGSHSAGSVTVEAQSNRASPPLIELRRASKRFVKSLDLAEKIGNRLGANVREEVVRAVDNVDIAVFPGEETAGYRTRWDAIQTGFVDEPRKAVEEADALVAQVVKRLTEVFADERTTLEHQWDRGEQVSTEDLRQALQKYRSFFQRLLAV